MPETTKFQKIKKLISSSLRNLHNNKLLITILTISSIVYPIILLGLSWQEFKNVNNISISLIFYSVVLYLLSTLIQMANWIYILKGNFREIAFDISTYFQTLLMQRLPGGFWQWIGRINLYNSNKSRTTNQTINASIYERIILIVSGLSCYLLFNIYWLGIILIIIVLLFMFFWQKKQNDRNWKKFYIPLLQMVSYIICWILGGYILSIIINFTIQPNTFPTTQAIPIWSLTGIISLIFFFLPGGLGIRELSLSTLLLPELTVSESIFVSLVLRFLFLAMDIVIGLSGRFIMSSIDNHDKFDSGDNY